MHSQPLRSEVRGAPPVVQQASAKVRPEERVVDPMSYKVETPLDSTAPAWASELSLDLLKRRCYAITCALGLLSVIPVLVWTPSDSMSDYDKVVYPMMVGLLSGLLVSLRMRKEALAFAETGLVATGVIFVLAKLFFIFYLEENRVNILPNVFALMGWVPVIYVGFFLVFNWHRGLFASLALYVAILSIGLPYLLSQFRGGNIHDFLALVQFYFAIGALVAPLYAFSKLRDYYALAQSRSKTLEYLATCDFLTGLSNRRMAQEVLAKQVAHTARHNRPVSVILFDLDHFKRVNDTFGHEVGDYVLKEVAGLMAQCLRAGDVLGRWGGEEFVVVCEGTVIGDATQMAERLRWTLESYPFDHVGTMTASFGVTSHADGDTPETMLKRADEALYQAKVRGRNRVDVLLAPSLEPVPITLQAAY